MNKELMDWVELYAAAMMCASRFGNKYGDMDAANHAWRKCKKAADELEAALEAANKSRDLWAATAYNSGFAAGIEEAAKVCDNQSSTNEEFMTAIWEVSNTIRAMEKK